MGVLGYYIRTRVNESPEFERAKDEKSEKVPLWGVLENRKINLLCTIGIGATSLIPLYLATIYMGFLMGSKLHITTPEIMIINTALAAFIVLFMPFMGQLADKIGKENQMKKAALLTFLLALPLFYFLKNNFCLGNVIFVQFVIAALNVAFVPPIMPLLTTYFPVHERYSGIGFGYALGGALLGGTTPVIIATLNAWHDSPYTPAYYLMFASLLGLISLKFGRSEFGKFTAKTEPQEEGYAYAKAS